MLVIKPLCPNCHSPNHQRKALCEWCGMSTEEEVSENIVYVPEADSLPTSNVSSNLSIDELLFKKRGEFKSGFLSKANACTFFFYRNRIVVKPAGLNRFFNSADIIIPDYEIVSVEPAIQIIGYRFLLHTRTQRFHLIFLGDKQMVDKTLRSYILNKA